MSISIPRNLVIFLLSMTILSIFKKGSGSLKKISLNLGEIEKLNDNAFAFNQKYILTSS